MTNDNAVRGQSGLNFNDLLFILFRRKWIVIACSLLGFIAAAAVHFTFPPIYESEAKLFVRYIVERSAIDPIEAQPRMADTIINSEVEILTSRDLAVDVAGTLLSERSSDQKSKAMSKADEIYNIQTGVTVVPLKNSNIILVRYKHGDPDWATRTLDELVKRYLAKHLEVHRSGGAFEYVNQQSSDVQTQLGKTEEELKKLKITEGIITLADSATALNAEYSQTSNDLRATETQLAEQQARVKELSRWISDSTSNAGQGEEVSRDATERYESLKVRISKLRQTEFELLSKYTAESSAVVRTRIQLEDAEAERKKLEKRHPSLALNPPIPVSGDDPRTTLIAERARLVSLEAKSADLSKRLDALRNSISRFSEVGLQITQLERKRTMEEENFKYYQASLDRVRTDETLDPSKMPNISVVQRPSSAVRISSKLEMKWILGLLLGGICVGIAGGVMTELVLDRSVKRPIELAGHLQIPMLCWIPLIGNNGRFLLKSGKKQREEALGKKQELATLDALWEPGHFIRTFAEEIRDRLLLFFELKGATHKPKLLAVTGCSQGSGTSTIAGGLATALSRSGYGRILLVDMHDAEADLHPFFEGCPIFSLADAVESKGAMCAAVENLYLATAALPLSEGRSISPRAFYELVPRFQSSDFDYVIFDMPPMNVSRSTLSIGRFMDKILLIVESGKDGRDEVLHSFADLRSTNVNVSAILNKTRSYTPRWLETEFGTPVIVGNPE